jgi:cellulose synthase/poly-beta-1,6-N-acetylglucosamine synthase-like glycosyltransferase
MWNIISSHRYLLKNNTVGESKVRNSVILLVPVYQETAIIANTFEYFYQIADKLNIKIIFITTEVEGSTATNETYLSVKKMIGKKSNVLLEHYPQARGSKANQLNYVMQKYEAQADYFAVFDVDSRPDIRGIQHVMQAANKTDIFQMPSIYLPHPSNSLASQTMAVFQTRWSYGFEIPKWRTWQDHPQSSHVMYVVGHGLFMQNHIRFAEQTIAEDLELGYRLSAQSATLSVVPYFDRALVPQNFRTAIIQSSRWYYGELLAPATFWQHAKDPNTNNVIRYIYRCVIRYAQILLWMLGPILVMASLIIALSNIQLFAIGLASIGSYWLLHAFICRYGHASYSSLILMPVKLIINGVGPMLCVGYTLLDILKIREFQFVKTKR